VGWQRELIISQNTKKKTWPRTDVCARRSNRQRLVGIVAGAYACLDGPGVKYYVPRVALLFNTASGPTATSPDEAVSCWVIDSQRLSSYTRTSL
jgi:hypothetical protein